MPPINDASPFCPRILRLATPPHTQDGLYEFSRFAQICLVWEVAPIRELAHDLYDAEGSLKLCRGGDPATLAASGMRNESRERSQYQPSRPLLALYITA